jgi:hypothetical protein
MDTEWLAPTVRRRGGQMRQNMQEMYDKEEEGQVIRYWRQDVKRCRERN